VRIPSQVLVSNNIVVRDVLLPLEPQQHDIASILNSINHRCKSLWYTMGVLVSSMHGYSCDRSLVFDLEHAMGSPSCYRDRLGIQLISRKCTVEPVAGFLEFPTWAQRRNLYQN
jgi:hypothetical protein